MSATTKPTVYPCDQELREQIRQLRGSGEISNAKLAKACGVNDAVISQYLNDAGCVYPGDVSKVERKLTGWLDRRNLEKLAGITTIQTTITEQISSALLMVQRCRIMGKAIGRSGVGKTRSITHLRDANEAIILNHISGETGTRESVRAAVYRSLGVQGPRKRTASRKRLMYAEACKRLKNSDTVLVFDQAHRLSLPAMEFLSELWNDTHSAQLWLGTGALSEKVERDEQVASRVLFTCQLTTETKEDVRPLVEHQVKALLLDLNGEFNGIVSRCESMAMAGNFRRVEMHLTTMRYLHENPRNKGKSWSELFDESSTFLTSDGGDL